MEWVVSVTLRPCFTPRERAPGTHCTRGWVGPRAGLDTEDRGKILCPCRGSNPDRPFVQPVVRHYTAWATPAPYAIYVAHRNSMHCSVHTGTVAISLFALSLNDRRHLSIYFFLFVVYLTALTQQVRLYNVEWKDDRWIGKDLEGSGHGLI
jgi:hypothetical protein